MRSAMWIAVVLGIGWIGCAREPRRSPQATATTAKTPATSERSTPPIVFSDNPSRATSLPETSLPAPRDEDTQRPVPSPNTLEARQEIAEELLDQALQFLGERRWSRALDALEKSMEASAREWLPPIVRRLQQQIVREKEAELVADDVQILLESGRFVEAHDLASQALMAFSHYLCRQRFASLYRQAVSWQMATAAEADRTKILQRLRQDYAEANQNRHWYACWVFLDELRSWSNEKERGNDLVALEQRLQRYEAVRRHGWTLWRQKERGDMVIAAFKEAAAIWTNPESLSELNEARLARRRFFDGLLAVAPIRMLGELGTTQTGSDLAEELAPKFRPRFEVLSHSQFQQRLRSVGLNENALHDELTQRKLSAALPEIRYLALGTLTPWAGVTLDLHVRDLKTGLVVLAIQDTAASREHLRVRLPEMVRDMLAQEDFRLVPSVEEQTAMVEEIQWNIPVDVEPLEKTPVAKLLRTDPIVPPRPIIPPVGDALMANVRQIFDRWPTLWADPAERPSNKVDPERYRLLSRKAAAVAVELGDDYLRRGYFIEARKQYEFAEVHGPESWAIRDRADWSRWLTPESHLISYSVPRVIVFDFFMAEATSGIPPHLPRRMSDYLAEYLAPEWEAVGRNESAYWLRRLGLSLSDILTDAAARMVAARALQARYCLFGWISREPYLDVRAYLLEAETGNLVSAGRIRARDWSDVKTRLAELGHVLKLVPQERQQHEATNAQWAWLLNEIDQARDRDRSLRRVVELAENGFKLRPESVEMRQIWYTTVQAQNLGQWDTQRVADEERLDNVTSQLQRQQSQIAFRAEQWRRIVENESPAEAVTRRFAQLRSQVVAARVTLAQQALAGQHWLSAAAHWQCAVDLDADPALATPDWAKALLQWENGIQLEQSAFAQTLRDATAPTREQRLEAFSELEREHQRRQMLRSQRGQQLLEQETLWANWLLQLAIASAQQKRVELSLAHTIGASRLHRSADFAQRIERLCDAVARAEAEHLAPEIRAVWLRRQSLEPNRKAAVEQDIQKKRQLLLDRIKNGQDALQQGKFDEAVIWFRQAQEIQTTEVGYRGLQQALAGQQARTDSDNSLRSNHDDTRNTRQLVELLREAESASKKQDLHRVVELLEVALRLAPFESSLRQKWLLAAVAAERDHFQRRREQDRQLTAEMVQHLLRSVDENRKAQRWARAAVNVETLRFFRPRDADVEMLHREIMSQLGSLDASISAKAEAYREAIRQGRRFLVIEQWDEALAEFRQAQVQLSGDSAADKLVEQAQRSLNAANRKNSTLVSNVPAGTSDWVLFHTFLRQMRKDLVCGRWLEARQHLAAAQALQADHPLVHAAQRELAATETSVGAEAIVHRILDDRWRDHVARAIACLENRQWQEAEQALRAASQPQFRRPIIKALEFPLRFHQLQLAPEKR